MSSCLRIIKAVDTLPRQLTMKKAVAIIFVVLAVGVTLAAKGGLQPDSNYEEVLDKVLTNERLLNSYFKCFLDTGPCSPEAQMIKRDMPELVKARCGKCSEKQKANAMKVIKYMQEKKPDQWIQFTKKYDPDRKNPDLYVKSN